MLRENLLDLYAFVAVSNERSFTRAAAKMGVSPSALSHTIRALETRLGILLLTRTTRSVAPTKAGLRLLQQIEPNLKNIEDELRVTQEMRDVPAGMFRVTAIDYVVDTILLPKIAPLINGYPDIKIDVVVDYGLTDIIKEGFDMGVRSGDQVSNDMVAVRISPDYKLAIVGADSYLAAHPKPKVPQDLVDHNCINLKLPTYGGDYSWELKKGKSQVNVRVDGQLSFNGVYQILNAALNGAGLAFIPEELARPYVESGHLQWVLDEWFPTFPGLHIYYPNRRQSSKAFSILIEALRYRN